MTIWWQKTNTLWGKERKKQESICQPKKRLFECNHDVNIVLFYINKFTKIALGIQNKLMMHGLRKLLPQQIKIKRPSQANLLVLTHWASVKLCEKSHILHIFYTVSHLVFYSHTKKYQRFRGWKQHYISLKAFSHTIELILQKKTANLPG